MSNPYVGEIRMFGGSFAPAGWAMCDGQLMPISENDILFTLIGTTYGGDGQETFGLPNLQGRVPMHAGQGPGISGNYQIGEAAGTESVTLTTQQIPIHTHPMLASGDSATLPNPDGNVASECVLTTPYIKDAPTVAMNNQIVSVVGGSQPHENMQQFLVLTFIISLFGVFPHQ
ncbi:MAG TPA: tail fiber protein [Pyrinomonadaceae bacterium]|jgi:microcystin-dependent protein